VKNILAFAAILLFVTTASAQTAPIKVRILYDTTDAASSAVAPLLIQKIAAQPKLFTVMNSNEEPINHRRLLPGIDQQLLFMLLRRKQMAGL